MNTLGVARMERCTKCGNESQIWGMNKDANWERQMALIPKFRTFALLHLTGLQFLPPLTRLNGAISFPMQW